MCGMIFWKRLGSGSRTRQFTIEHSPQEGWIAREEIDTSVHTNLIRNWQAVEWAILSFEIKASTLRSEGWLEQG
jgi:hypothetical protein